MLTFRFSARILRVLNRETTKENYIMLTFIITNPNITALYVGQLVTEKSLPSLLEENFVTKHDIEVLPYTIARHEKYIALGKEIYSKIDDLDYYKVY